MRLSLPCRAVMMTLAALSLASSASAASVVSPEDLAVLSDEQLAPLKDTEFGVLLAEVGLARARAAEETAKIRLAEAKQKLKVEELDLKAAEAESKAVLANQRFGKDEKSSPALVAGQQAERTDLSERTARITTRLEAAKRERERAEAFVAWKDAQVDAAALHVERAQLGIEEATVSRETARVEALRQTHPTVAAKYSQAALSARTTKSDAKVEKAVANHAAAATRAETARLAYEAIPGSPVTTNPVP